MAVAVFILKSGSAAGTHAMLLLGLGLVDRVGSLCQDLMLKELILFTQVYISHL